MIFFGSYLKTLRKKYELTQEQLGIITGLNDTIICTLETRATKPDELTEERLRRFFFDELPKSPSHYPTEDIRARMVGGKIDYKIKPNKKRPGRQIGYFTYEDYLPCVGDVQ